MTLDELIERVEKGEGADRELDLAVIKEVWPFALVLRHNSETGENETATYHNPTTSLDSVVMLIEQKLTGSRWLTVGYAGEKPDEGCVSLAGQDERHDGKAASPARALLAATLRAIKETRHDG